MKAFELAFPETSGENPYDIMGPLTARIATIRTLDGRPHVITGNTDISTAANVAATATQNVSNPITRTIGSGIASFLRDSVWIIVGVIILAIALVRLTRG